MPTYSIDGKTHTVELKPTSDGYQATIRDDNGATRTYTLTAQAVQSGEWMLNTSDARARVHTASQGNTRYASVDGESFTFTIPEPKSARRGSRRGHGAGDLTAQMPGQVRDVLVSEGDTVERGQTLVVLEAMKMEIRVSAPNDGRITRILVNKGETVDRGQVLVEME